MGNTSQYIFFLLFVIFYFVNGKSNNLSEKESVVFVAPVLAPYKNTRARGMETAKDFPILMLLSTGASETRNDKHKLDEHTGEVKPIYVEVSHFINYTYTTVCTYSML